MNEQWLCNIAWKEKNPRLVIFIRSQLAPDTSERREDALIREGAEVLHLVADEYGLEKAENPLFIKERMKQIHLNLVESGLKRPGYSCRMRGGRYGRAYGKAHHLWRRRSER